MVTVPVVIDTVEPDRVKFLLIETVDDEKKMRPLDKTAWLDKVTW